MRTHFKSDTPTFVNSFLLLVMVAGVLHIDLLESVAVAEYSDHRTLYRIELVFNAEHPSQSPVLSVYEDAASSAVVKDRIHAQHFYAASFGIALSITKKNGQAENRSFHSSHHASSFNIPHQNSEEDEAFILPGDVA